MASSLRVYEALTPFPSSNDDQFSILSFNILTKAFDSKHYYQYCPSEFRKWNYRYPKIKEIIKNYCSDIICLQEVDPFSFEIDFDILRTESNYDAIIDKSDTKKKKYANDQKAASLIIKPATFYRRDKFKVMYSEFRSRAIISLFELINDHQQFVFIVNCHLEGAPRKWEVRFKQIKSILSRITYRCQVFGLNEREIPLLICGDFNDGIYSSIHKTLIEGALRKNYFDLRFGQECGVTKEDYIHCFDFAESYEPLQQRPPTFAANGVIGIVDFLYFTKNNMECLGVSRPLPAFMMNDLDSLLLPNENWPSDHLPIGGLYQIKNKNMAKVDHEQKREKKKQKQKNKNKRKGDWLWHSIQSF